MYYDKNLKTDREVCLTKHPGLAWAIRREIIDERYQLHGNERRQMRKHIWVRLAILFVTISTLSGCIWPYGDERGRGGEHHDEHHGEDEGGRR